MAVAVVVEPLLSAPCDRAGITITGLGIGASVVSVWRTADGERAPVRGYRRVAMNDAAYVVDFDAPLGRPVSYEVEVVSGPGGASRTVSDPVTIDSVAGVLMDPLVPQTAVPVVGARDSDGAVYLKSPALSQLEYRAEVSIFNVMGSDKPLALFGQRMAESGLDTSLATRSAEENARLKKLLRSTGQLLFKPLPSWGEFELNGTLFLANASAKQLPIDVSWGGELTWWDLQSDVVAAPTIRVLTAEFTYGDVALLFSTYQAKQDAVVAAAAAAGESPTYLFDLKRPLG
ncbi:hypothetical protein [Paenarthrobacter sp.]|uniref:hypothetical protein n=1 Tax=Paenarthrobacter sp. TaxID=1931993 RepID=UPI002811BD24|nr:hypothetical protein [Paenarthrobacter sp.]